jgi:predicted RNase H-like nuclease (RuvC/YqgF family)
VGRRTERQTGNAERKCYNFMQATTFFIISVDKITELYNLITWLCRILQSYPERSVDHLKIVDKMGSQ